MFIQPMTPGRVLGLLLAAAPLVALWHLIPQPARAIDETRIEGTILSVTVRSLESRKGGRNTIRMAQVELPDGGKARIFLNNSQWAKGDVVQLSLRRFEDGTKQVTPVF